jgi:glyoxylase-like metal-dependent hydrolase (beta-lactamase superfamily II)
VVRPLSGDTALTFGRDTVHVFSVPGHTAGSTVYLIRGMLLAGDAIYRGFLGGFRPAMSGYSDDTAAAAHSLATLFRRLEPFTVDSVCTAHGRCAAFSPEFRADALKRD